MLLEWSHHVVSETEGRRATRPVKLLGQPTGRYLGEANALVVTLLSLPNCFIFESSWEEGKS